MKGLAAFSIRNSVLVHLMIAGLLLVGTWSLIQLPRELMSEIAFNWVFIRVDWPNAAPQEIEQQIAVPVEEALDKVDGVSSVSLRCKEGFAFFSVKFESVSNDDFDSYYTQLKDEVGLLQLPEEAEEPFFLNFSSQDFVPMVTVVIHGELPPDELFDLAERVEDDVASISGIGKIEVGGTRERQILVSVDPDALAAHGLAMTTIAGALSASNTNIPGGVLAVGPSEYMIRTVNQFGALQDIEEVVLGSGAGGLVRLSDVAAVNDTWEEAKVFSRFDGETAVSLSISKKAGGNSIDLIDQIQGLVDDYNVELDDRVKVSVSGDSSLQIENMLSDLQTNALFGMVLVVLVLWIFLGLRNALITAIGIPLAFLSTFIFMLATGETLNGNSLFGLVLVLGIIVDDAIVLMENAVRHRSMGKSRFDAVVDGVSEVALPVVAAILTTIAAFLPLMLMPGILGKFMRIIPVVVSMALVASLVEALISMPCHIYEWGEQDEEKLEARGAWFQRFIDPYSRALSWLVEAKVPRGGIWSAVGLLMRVGNLFGLVVTGLLFFAAVPTLMFAIFGPAGAWIGGLVPIGLALVLLVMLLVRGALGPMLAEGWRRLGNVRWNVFAGVYLGMIPLAVGIASTVDLDLFSGDEIPQFFVRVRLPEGTALGETDRVIREMERLTREALPEGELKSITANAGLLMTDAEWFIKRNVGQLIVDLEQAKDRERALRDIVAELRPVLAQVPGPDSLEVVPTNSGPPAGSDVELKIQGDDLDRLVEVVAFAEDEMRQVDGVEDIRNDWVLGKTELRVQVDGQEAALHGVSERDVGLALRAAFEGLEATTYRDGDEDVPVIVRYAEASRHDLSWIDRTRVPSKLGGMVPLADVARVETTRAIDAIRRYKGSRTVTVTASVDPNVATPVAATQQVQKRLAGLSERFPGYKVDYSGEFEEFQKSLEALVSLGVLGMLLVYLILGAQFRSFVQPIIIIGFTFPGAVLGSSIALLVTGTPLSMLTMYGVVALLGIVVNDSLVFISFINQCRSRGLAVADAVIEAGKVRLRPIVLTTVTTVFGLAPMALGLGGKSDAWGPLATTIVFGLIVATLTTLFVIPPVYRCVADLGEVWADAWRRLGVTNHTHEELPPVVAPQPA